MCYDYIIESYVWIEYLRGSKMGKKVRRYIEEEHSVTPAVVITELSRKLLKEVK